MLECLQSMVLDHGWGSTHRLILICGGSQILSLSHVHLQIQLEILTRQSFSPESLPALSLSTHSRQDELPASGMVQNLPRLPQECLAPFLIRMLERKTQNTRSGPATPNSLPSSLFYSCPYHVRKSCMYPDIFGVSETPSRCFHTLLSS